MATWKSEARAPVVGIIGGGQLARMMFQSALSLGIEVHILRSESDESLNKIAKEVTTASQFDPTTLYHFARKCDVVTFDHELIPAQLVQELSDRNCTIFPSADTLALAADKAKQRKALQAEGIPVPKFAVVETAMELEAISTAFEFPLVLKAARGGFDGRGVHRFSTLEQATQFMRDTKSQVPYVVESELEIEAELAVLVVTGQQSADRVTYPPIQTRQFDGICVEAFWPTELDPEVEAEAIELAMRVADTVGSVGVLAVEFFLVDGKLLVNELAPRVHNSGHLTIEGAVTSQFENHLRAVTGLPLGSTEMISPVAMVNLIPADSVTKGAINLEGALLVPEAKVHDYSKTARPNRKIAHISVLAEDAQSALKRAWEAARASLQGRILGDPEDDSVEPDA